MTGDPFADVRDATRRHQSAHRCGAHVYRDGALLGVVGAIAAARRIVEVGTALGYSALWLAHGAPEATVDTIEGDAEHVRLARAQLTAHGADSRVRVHHGRAEQLLPALAHDVYDVAFFDGFAPTVDLIAGLRALLRPGGVLIAGNLTMAREGVQGELADAARWLTFSLGETALAVKRVGAVAG
jgi:predicted O-methyltransferase YrrM